MATQPKYSAPFEAQFDHDRALEYVIRNLLRRTHTADLVQVTNVTPGTSAVGFLTVQPVILDQDTNGIVIVGTPIFNVPFIRYQSGLSAVIMDPVIGDIGLAIFGERDITGVKARAIQGQPLAGAAVTDRVHSSADALYIGGMLNGAPTQWVKFLPSAGGIDITTPGSLTLEAQTITTTSTGTTTINAQALVINAPTTINSTLATTQDITVEGKSLINHTHPGVTAGTVNTGTMQN